jgi:SPP1 gp7 family putative phage head morphogenesis protein
MLDAKPSERQVAATKQRVAKERFRKAQMAERKYERQLVAVGREVGKIVDRFTKEDPLGSLAELEAALAKYSTVIEPWAAAVTKRMHDEVAWRNLTSWRKMGKEIGRGLTMELMSAPHGPAFHQLLDSQVTLIQSLPIEAGRRVHQLTTKALLGGSRGSIETIADDIYATGHVTMSRARLIARTETARTASVLTQVRAEYVGSTGYVWRTMRDDVVRDAHKALEGTVHRWDRPPEAGSGMRYHPGQGPNCRCYADPILS